MVAHHEYQWQRLLCEKTPKQLNDGTPFDGFESGKNVTLTYSFVTKKPDQEWGNKIFWLDGLKNIPDPSTKDWGKYTPLQKVLNKWNLGDGWYNCSKKHTNDSQYKDMNKCWAATA